MSYDYGIGTYSGNHTTNIWDMWYEALKIKKHISELTDFSTKELIEKFEKAIKDMKNRKDYYKIMNPSNGWGNYERAVKELEDILKHLKKYKNEILD